MGQMAHSPVGAELDGCNHASGVADPTAPVRAASVGPFPAMCPVNFVGTTTCGGCDGRPLGPHVRTRTTMVRGLPRRPGPETPNVVPSLNLSRTCPGGSIDTVDALRVV